MTKKTSLYIVDDYKIIAEGIKLYLSGNEQFEFIGSSLSANNLFKFLKQQQPDILILDIKLPGLSGFQIAKIVREKYPAIKIVFLSSNNDKVSLNEAIEAGGVGYFFKDIDEKEFLMGIAKIDAGENYYCSSMQQAVFKSFTEKVQTKKSSNETPLSSREIDVIKLFVEGFSYKEIANKLSISTRTVETHKKNILTKLELKTTVDLVKYAILNGIISI